MDCIGKYITIKIHFIILYEKKLLFLFNTTKLALLLNFIKKENTIRCSIENIIDKQIPKNAVILFGILNWGLGHASRSLPLIKLLQQKGHNVHVVSDGLPIEWLKKEIPDVVFHKMNPSFFVYPTSYMWLNVMMMFPRFVKFVLDNKKYAELLAHSTGANVLISDNRFGFRCSDIALNIYITHQISIHHKHSFLQKILSKAHQYFIKKYDFCWVPDSRDNPLAGKLSSSSGIKDIFYLGNMSRLSAENKSLKKYDILILLSGPEPQRSYFEENILRTINHFNDKNICLVRGTTKPLLFDSDAIKTIIHLADTPTLQKVIEESELIICRSGYSTIMDLDQFDKKVIFVPTPGQTEQEYLAFYHSSKNVNYFIIKQNEIFKNLPYLINKLL